jgi:hypothetical protein
MERGRYDDEAGPSSATVVPQGLSLGGPSTSQQFHHTVSPPYVKGCGVPGPSQGSSPVNKGKSSPSPRALAGPLAEAVGMVSEADGVRADETGSGADRVSPGSLAVTAQPAPLANIQTRSGGTAEESAPAQPLGRRLPPVSEESAASVADMENATERIPTREAGEDAREFSPSGLGSGPTESGQIQSPAEVELRVPLADSSSSEPTAVDVAPLAVELKTPNRTAAAGPNMEDSGTEIGRDSPAGEDQERLKQAAFRDPNALLKLTGIDIKEVEEALAQPDDWDFMDDLPASQQGDTCKTEVLGPHWHRMLQSEV